VYVCARVRNADLFAMSFCKILPLAYRDVRSPPPPPPACFEICGRPLICRTYPTCGRINNSRGSNELRASENAALPDAVGFPVPSPLERASGSDGTAGTLTLTGAPCRLVGTPVRRSAGHTLRVERRRRKRKRPAAFPPERKEREREREREEG